MNLSCISISFNSKLRSFYFRLKYKKFMMNLFYRKEGCVTEVCYVTIKTITKRKLNFEKKKLSEKKKVKVNCIFLKCELILAFRENVLICAYIFRYERRMKTWMRWSLKFPNHLKRKIRQILVHPLNKRHLWLSRIVKNCLLVSILVDGIT